MKSRVETGVIVWIILVINKLFFMIFSVIFLLGFATVSLFPIEQARIVSLLVKDITINPDGLNIRIFKEGLHSLSNELNG